MYHNSGVYISFPGTSSPLLQSPVADRKFNRRDGVAEKNEVESQLIREALDTIKKNECFKQYNLV